MVPLDPSRVRLGVEHGVVLVHAEQLGRGEGEEEVDVVVVLFLVLLAWRGVLVNVCVLAFVVVGGLREWVSK